VVAPPPGPPTAVSILLVGHEGTMRAKKRRTILDSTCFNLTFLRRETRTWNRGLDLG
jgi:hypothetical protein